MNNEERTSTVPMILDNLCWTLRKIVSGVFSTASIKLPPLLLLNLLCCQRRDYLTCVCPSVPPSLRLCPPPSGNIVISLLLLCSFALLHCTQSNCTIYQSDIKYKIKSGTKKPSQRVKKTPSPASDIAHFPVFRFAVGILQRRIRGKLPRCKNWQ